VKSTDPACNGDDIEGQSNSCSLVQPQPEQKTLKNFGHFGQFSSLTMRVIGLAIYFFLKVPKKEAGQ
jgi:hypothetical protein